MRRIVHDADARINPGAWAAVAHDLREPGAVEALHKARAVWGPASDLEALGADLFMLVILPAAAEIPAERRAAA